jgi:exodeoxyribonuclease V gamma subunit
MQPLPVLEIAELNFEQLVRFWRHPVRAFFSQRLGVSFIAEEAGLPDAEPFTLDNLSRYQVNTQLLNTLIDEQPSEPLYARQRASGNLPYGAYGELFWLEQQEEMAELASRVREQRAGAVSWEIALTIGGIQLNGWLPQVQDDGLLRWRPGHLNFTDGLSLWLEHLVYCTLGGQGESRMVGRKESQWRFPALPAEQAREWLGRYVEGYQQGMCSPLLLLPRTGGAWLEACYDEKTRQLLTDDGTQAKARIKLLQAWQGNMQIEGEGSDPYLARLFRTLDDEIVQQISHNAEIWLLPLLQMNDMQ